MVCKFSCRESEILQQSFANKHWTEAEPKSESQVRNLMNVADFKASFIGESTTVPLKLGQGGTSILGLYLASSLEAKFGVRSPNKRKNLGSSGTTRDKNWDIIPGKRILYWLLRCYKRIHRLWESTEIFHTDYFPYIWHLKGKIWGSCHKFLEAKSGPSSPRPPDMEVVPGIKTDHFNN